MSDSIPNSALERVQWGVAETAPAVPRSVEEEVLALFDQFRNRLFRYVVSTGVSPHDGEDVIQEVFLSLHRHLRLGRSRKNLQGWLFRVAHNLALKQRNARSKARAKTEVRENPAAEKCDPSLNPEEQLGRNQRQEQLLGVVRALSEQDRSCLYMRAEGLRYREIADVLGMSLGAVSNSLARSFARLNRADQR